MSIKDKLKAKREKNLFAFENKDFICRYDLIAKKSMTKARLRRELDLSKDEFNKLEAEYLKHFNGIQ